MRLTALKTCAALALLFSLLCLFANTKTARAMEDSRVYRGSEVPLEVETMYQKGLNYIAAHANDSSGSRGNNRPAVAGLCMLAILAHGDDPEHGPYKESLGIFLEDILKAQNKENGYIGSSMYNHGFATLALAEAYGAVRDQRIGPALKKAVELLLSSQARNPTGGWRYGPESSDGDSTISGACAVALVAARNAGLNVPDRAIQKLLKFYNTCFDGQNGFAYTPGSGASPMRPTTAIGVAVFAYVRAKQARAFRTSFRAMQRGLKSGQSSGSHFYYSLYYLSQALFQADVRVWRIWNQRNIKLLQKTQLGSGAWNGGSNGPLFATSTALLSLALNYRYLPIYER